MSAPVPNKSEPPHWLTQGLIWWVAGIVAALLVTWLGLNEWRFPWVEKPSMSQSTGPITVDRAADGAVKLSWTPINDERLDRYDITVVAVEPVSFTFDYPVARYPGIAPPNERIYPERELNTILQEAGRDERVTTGQIWEVCVTAMMASEVGDDVAPSTLEETQACSDDFVTP